ncbi:DUF982 domain-containing protein [Mesorhizobium sp. NPDC059025]|uniref:DUF982 domain-containing protein n=1 Tax=unclassified Mesorhizobium TaxID=325217 RepID=UPI003673246F
MNHGETGTFENPVTVRLPSGKRLVTSTREAAELLLYDWPIGETGQRIMARMACMRVLGGGSEPEIARQAFLAAAKEAKILTA